MSKLIVKVDDKVFEAFDNSTTEYRYLVQKSLDAIPMVSVVMLTADTDGSIREWPVDVIQAMQLPDCAIFEALGKTYRIRFAKEGAWTDISTEIYDAFAVNPQRATPEFPYTWDYSQTCVMKLFLATPDKKMVAAACA